ncbi:hypothetical protein LTR85_004445 [Meristemomyces frigidus]|nr:hypothetical protein LTR85_004445 [Meristemomyces frigidus]
MAAPSETSLATLQELNSYVRDTEQDIFDSSRAQDLSDTQKLMHFCKHNAAAFIMDQIDENIKTVRSGSRSISYKYRADQQSALELAQYCIVARGKVILSSMSNLQQRIGYFDREVNPATYTEQQVRHMNRIGRMLGLMVDGLKLPAVHSALDCAPNDKSSDKCKGHLHTHEGLIWAEQDRDIEKRLIAYDEPAITFRDFQYTIVQHEHEGGTKYGSALRAMAHALSGGKPQRGQLYATFCHNAKAIGAEREVRKNTKRLPEALACIGFQALVSHRREHPGPELGIILPGGSEVFWPSKTLIPRPHETIYIKVVEKQADGETAYIFHAVNVLPRAKGGQMEPQTLSFLDIPAEIRNDIYEAVLDLQEATPGIVFKGGRYLIQNRNRTADKRSERQPALSLTCRQVNKELMSLVFKRQKIFVCT